MHQNAISKMEYAIPVEDFYFKQVGLERRSVAVARDCVDVTCQVACVEISRSRAPDPTDFLSHVQS